MASFIRVYYLFCVVSVLTYKCHAWSIPRAGEAISGDFPIATSSPSTISFLSINSTAIASTSTQEGPTTCTVDRSLITPNPAWGPQDIPENSCSFTYDTIFSGEPTSTCILSWSSCRFIAKSVHLYYWTDLPGNQTHPASIWNTKYNITMTSPSVYVAYVTMSASNDCGRIGPLIATTVLPYDLDQISTLLPYAGTSAFTLTGTQKRPNAPLTLSDFENCEGQATKTYDPHFPLPGDNYRCNPQIYFIADLHKVGYPYWYGCGRKDGGSFGLDDPPHAITPCTSDDCLFPEEPDTPDEIPNPTTSAVPLPPTTSTPVPPVTSDPNPTTSAVPPPPATSSPVPPASSDIHDDTPEPTDQTTLVGTPSSLEPTSPVDSTPTPFGSSSQLPGTTPTFVAPSSNSSPEPVSPSVVPPGAIPSVILVPANPAPCGCDTNAAPSGPVVQLPSGEINTTPVVAKPTVTSGNNTTPMTTEPAQFTGSAVKVNVGIGGIIAGIMGALML